MNIQPDEQKTQAISDDQELAKVLAGVNDSDDETANPSAPDSALPPMPMPDAPAPEPSQPADSGAPAEPSAMAEPTMAMTMPPMPAAPAPAPTGSGDLESIKQEALGELRPLVDKLEVSPEEKFDTYLLLLRSTDDRDLIAPAHAAAKMIGDEARKAQALLDIIKEIDFLSKQTS